MPPVKLSELPELIGKSIVVQVNVTDSDDEDFREITGKCITANAGGLVVQTRSNAEMIQLADIMDIEIEDKPKRVVRRYIDQFEYEDEALASISELAGRVVVVEYEADAEGVKEVTGKCISATDLGVLLEVREQFHMIKLAVITDIGPKARKLVKRYLDRLEADSIRQHLVDRHGMAFDLVKSMNSEQAMGVHNATKHLFLGHEHGPKPTRGTKYTRPVD